VRAAQSNTPGIFGEVVRNVLTFFLRMLIALNFIRFALSFFAGFEGSEHSLGWVDRNLGDYRLGGFEIDFVWILLSTPIIFFATFYFLSRTRINQWAYVDVAMCLACTLGFFVFLYRELVTGNLYFG
jgi:hypothetical protein